MLEKIMQIKFLKRFGNTDKFNVKNLRYYNFTILCFFNPIHESMDMIETVDMLAVKKGVQQLYLFSGGITEKHFQGTAEFWDFHQNFEKTKSGARKIKKIFINPNKEYDSLIGYELVKHIYRLCPVKEKIVIMAEKEERRFYDLEKIKTIGDFQYVKFPTSYKDFCDVLEIEM